MSETKINPIIASKSNFTPLKQTSFTGSYTKQITDSLHHANTIRRMERLKWLKGEIGGILITALGTGLVAPIFIGFNPFVRPPKNATPEQKEDIRNTKQYTAMRQPISAVLAILFQASVQKYIDKGLDKVFNDPKYANFARVNLDQSKLNTENRVKDLVKEDMKKAGRKKPSLIKTWFDKKAKEERAQYTIDFDDKVKAKQEAQINSLAEEFEKTGSIKPGERTVKSSKVAELVNKQIDEYINEARKLQKTEDGQIPYYLERGRMLIENEDKLKEILQPIQAKGDVTVEELNTLVAQNKNNPEIQALLKEIINKPDYLRMNRINRTIQRIDTIKNLLGDNVKLDGKFNKEAYRTKLIQRNNILSDIISRLAGEKIVDPKAADENIIKKRIDNIAEICDFSKQPDAAQDVLKDTDTFGINGESKKLTKKVFKDITKRYKKLVANQYKSWNQFTKIGIGVFITLPITCTALNWVYPRFMEIFFPKLAGVKKAQQTQKEQNKVGGDK